MKRFLVGLLMFGSVQMWSQNPSCVVFASMPEVEANRFLKQLQSEIDIKTIAPEHVAAERAYVDTIYVKTQHIHTCLNLRDAQTHSPEDFQRAEALRKLRNQKLDADSKALYEILLEESISFYQMMSGDTLTQPSACGHPLLFLSAQSTPKGVLVYELRQIDHEIKSFHGYVNTLDELPWQCDQGTTRHAYLSYLDEKGIKFLPVSNSNLAEEKEKENIYSRDNFMPKKQHERTPEKKIYVINKPLSVVDYASDSNKEVQKGSEVLYLKSTSTEVFLMYENTKYRTNKTSFTKATKSHKKDKK